MELSKFFFLNYLIKPAYKLSINLYLIVNSFGPSFSGRSLRRDRWNLLFDDVLMIACRL